LADLVAINCYLMFWQFYKFKEPTILKTTSDIYEIRLKSQLKSKAFSKPRTNPTTLVCFSMLLNSYISWTQAFQAWNYTFWKIHTFQSITFACWKIQAFQAWNLYFLKIQEFLSSEYTFWENQSIPTQNIPSGIPSIPRSEYIFWKSKHSSLKVYILKIQAFQSWNLHSGNPKAFEACLEHGFWKSKHSKLWTLNLAHSGIRSQLAAAGKSGRKDFLSGEDFLLVVVS